MNPDEINEACARKMGIDPKATFSGVKPDGSLAFNIPDYCHSIEATFEIIDYILIQKRGSVRMEKNFSSQWYIAFGVGSKLIDNVSQPLAMAICLTFLKLEDKNELG